MIDSGDLVSCLLNRISVTGQDRFYGESRIRAAGDAATTYASRNPSSTIHRKH